ncbi:MAG: deoxyribose-phosphate aldolase [Xanthomonadaceae bacterium]|nr:deoxyribose-phosphate aldolase [Xanthomonadaceae bacterium]
MKDQAESARQALRLMDLTRLEDDVDEQPVRALCTRVSGLSVYPAAVCVYPRFVPTARRTLEQHGLADRIKLATVANFPGGDSNVKIAFDQTKQAIALGADEVDVVFPWQALIAKNGFIGLQLVQRCKTACGDRILKVILETGKLTTPERIREAAELAIVGGADFLKTSTGKVATNATPEAARVVLETIAGSAHNVGFKVSGGVRTLADAKAYMNLATEIMGKDWMAPNHFRIGASGLLDDLLAIIDKTPGGSSA